MRETSGSAALKVSRHSPVLPGTAPRPPEELGARTGPPPAVTTRRGMHAVAELPAATASACPAGRPGYAIVLHDFCDAAYAGRWFGEVVHPPGRNGHDDPHVVRIAAPPMPAGFREVALE